MRKKTLDEFIAEARKIHGDKYDYTSVDYKNINTKVSIKCPIHGVFSQTPHNHIYLGQGCPLCGTEQRSKSQIDSLETFVSKAVARHGDVYDYTKAVYLGSKKPLEIVCKEHGSFWQRPNDHLIGRGCPVCGGRKRSVEDFIRAAKAIHGEKYDYSNVTKGYGDEKVSITCLKCGKTFLQKPWSHLQGHGCPYCVKSRLEGEIEAFLMSNGVEFEREKMFDWLGRMSLDFYVPTHNVAIECQGEQHFVGSRCFGHKELEDVILARDKRKLELCNANGIRVLYYTNAPIPSEYIGYITNDKEQLLRQVLL